MTTMEAHTYCAPDSMSAAAAHVDREYGCTGYRIGLAGVDRRIAIFEVVCSDGSRFNLLADRWGNVRRVPDEATPVSFRTIVDCMAEAASVV